MTVKVKMPRGSAKSYKTLLVFGVAVAIFLLVCDLRVFHLARSFDIFIDEITYARIADSVRLNGWPSLYGQPFYLHPPMFFYLETLYMNLVKPSADLFEEIYAVRNVNVIMAGCTAVAIFAIVRCLSSAAWGIFAALLFAIDAFVIRINSLNLLDTGALLWVTAGYAVLICSSDDAKKTLPRKAVLLTGILFGFGLLTKEMTAFESIVIMGGILITGWYFRRRDVLLIIAVESLTYSFYIVGVIAVGQWTTFYNEKLSGVLRLAGISQETGLNRAQGPSLVDKILERLSEFGMTYLVIALGVLGILILLLWGRKRWRMIALWAVGAYALLSYSVFFGTLEEQFFYFLVVPCDVVVSLAFARVLVLLGNSRKLRAVVVALLVLFASIFCIVNGREWLIRHTQPDNAYEQVRDYVQETFEPNTGVASSSETGQFLLQQYSSAPWGSWYSIDDITSFAPPFVLLSYDQLAWDFGELAQPMIDWVQTHGTKRFEVQYRSNHLVLFQMNYPKQPN